MSVPVLWSFRRCPYAMRARLALCISGQKVELREILLREKPEAFLTASPSATVPCLEIGEYAIDESLDIMHWALAQHDPHGWLDMPEEGAALIQECDGPFKDALDHYKYATRYPDHDPAIERARASTFMQDLDARLTGSGTLFGKTHTLADMAILPFVRQFAHVDLAWFEAQPWPNVISWLEGFKTSDLFGVVMKKVPTWDAQANPVVFPTTAQ